MIGFGGTVDDGALVRAEEELRGMVTSLNDANGGPSQPYWDMYATRVMARIGRSERTVLVSIWRVLWKPVAASATIAAAVAAFVLLHPQELSLDNAAAALPAADIQLLRQSEAPLAPVGAADISVASELANASDPSVDMDAVLVFSDVNPDQAFAAAHSSPIASESYGMDELNDEDAIAVLNSLKSTM